tara:strand:- start:42 stop:1007 length:966 start_codon:yes stop_codon:yes gene_type:complete
MKKEITTLSILSAGLVLFYFLFPVLQENIYKEEINDGNREDLNFDQTSQTIQNYNTSFLTFDIVRISKTGDIVIAGKSEPNETIELLDGEEIIAEVISDENGEWIWVSELTTKNGIKKFQLQYKNNLNKSSISDQTVIILVDNESNSVPKVARVFRSDVENIDMLNLEKLNDAITLDFLSYSPPGLIIMSGRTISNTEIEILKSSEVLGKTKSNENGVWKFIINKNDANEEISIKTTISGETLILTYDEAEIKKRFKNTNFEFYDDRIIVQKGNSLWRIARKTLGGGIFYTEIYKNNLAKIKNPNLIYPGQVFNIPIRRNK